jgi:prepilin-type N-terminal cleavage/methylation domain-containing protein
METKKQGFTLLELMVVVILIGILSMMAYASLRDAIYQTRVKDAGINTAAFLNRVSIDAKRRDTTLCVQVDAAGNMAAHEAADGNLCPDDDPGNEVDKYSVPGGFTAVVCGWANPIPIVPQIGLSALPREGKIVMPYLAGFCAAAIKTADQNNAVGKWTRGGSCDCGTVFE